MGRDEIDVKYCENEMKTWTTTVKGNEIDGKRKTVRKSTLYETVSRKYRKRNIKNDEEGERQSFNRSWD